MIKAETIEQFYVLKWLQAYFETELLEIMFVDRYTVRIKDIDNKTACVVYAGKDNITLTEEE